ncbi:MAG: class I poly(R)-hydroxyalkanoic acid synthase [Alphaproteobacteria bacterium]
MAKKSATQRENADPPPQPVDAQLVAENLAKAGDLWQRILQELTAHTLSHAPSMGSTDPMALAESMLHVMRHMNVDPVRVAQMQLGLVQDHFKLWQAMTGKLLGKADAPFIEAAPKDRRFRDAAWQESPLFDYLKQGYLINAQWLEAAVKDIGGLDAHTARKLNFFTRQFIDALSPSNYLLTNPEAMRATLDSNGDNIVRGLTHLLEDIEKGGGSPRISMTDESAFSFGRDIAATKGSVVFENDLMQLIQYEATTPKVHKTPLLLTPAWINKYYILDLSPENSLVKWLTGQGYTVFIVSWVNPDERQGRKEFADYLLEGPLAALEIIEQITGEKQTALIGYCLGGTLTAITLAYLRAKGQQDRVVSATFLTTLVDFAEAGDLSVFIDDTQLTALEERMSEQGYLEASDMAATFNMLRSNDLIWSFVINNYLLGKQPFPFDLLYWNSDSTRMPAKMHAFYLRSMYQNNLLVKPGGIELDGVPINLGKIATPAFLLATKEDHIAPWKSAYVATQIYDGPVTFVLTDSGHIAGVVNPPVKKKYGYWTNDRLPPKPEDWLASVAPEHKGSWWPLWDKWQQKQLDGEMVKARKVGSAKHKPIEPAPGRYARVRA